MPSKLATIRDPLYGYVSYSRLERTIMDQPLFQRLRYVSQNGLVHLTYPSNRTQRFTHSLGTMHVGGRLFLNGIRNASPATLDSFYVDANHLMAEAMTSARFRPAAVVDSLRRSRDGFYAYHGLDMGTLHVDEDPHELPRVVTEAILFQSVRLACIVHDVGHFPFSHTVEAALTGQLAIPPESDDRLAFQTLLTEVQDVHPGTALHEAVGLALIEDMFSTREAKAYAFGQVCRVVSSRIAAYQASQYQKSPADRVVSALHDIVSGDFDADRADWVRRDGHASGFEFGAFDYDRIADLVELIYIPRDHEYQIRPSISSLSAVESFFIERFRIYRWLIHQNNVVRADLCLQRVVHLLFLVYFRELPDVPMRVLDDLQAVLRAAEFDRFWRAFQRGPDGRHAKLSDYAETDEVWFLTLLRKVDTALASVETGSESLNLLATYLAFILRRRKSRILPLWKRLEEYLEVVRGFAEQTRVDSDGAIAAFLSNPANAQLTDAAQGCGGGAVGPKSDDVSTDLPAAVEFMNLALRTQVQFEGQPLQPVGGNVPVIEQLEDQLQERLDWPGQVLFRMGQGFRPGPEASFSLVTAGTTPVPLVEMSSSVAGLTGVWNRDMQAFAFVIPPPGDDEDDSTPQLPDRQAFGAALAQTLLDPKWRLLALLLPGRPARRATAVLFRGHVDSIARLLAIALIRHSTGISVQQLAMRLRTLGATRQLGTDEDVRSFVNVMISEGAVEMRGELAFLTDLGIQVLQELPSQQLRPLVESSD